MRAKHDEYCASTKKKRHAKCDCEMGRLRQVKKIAVASMKRREKRDFRCWWIEKFFVST
jgi:hypothetical protein